MNPGSLSTWRRAGSDFSATVHSFSGWPATSSPRIYRAGTCQAKGLWLPARGQRRNSGHVASSSRRDPLPRLHQCKRFRLDVQSKASSVYQRFHGAAERRASLQNCANDDSPSSPMALEWNDYRTVAIRTRNSHNNDCHDRRTATVAVYANGAMPHCRWGCFTENSLDPSTNARAERISRTIHRLDAGIERHELVALSAR